MATFFVYILASSTRTIYIGVTNDLERRVWEHRFGDHDGFTRRYQVDRLVLVEEFGWIDDAIAREKQLKGWSRRKKVALIEARNPRWNDLAWNWDREPRDG